MTQRRAGSRDKQLPAAPRTPEGRRWGDALSRQIVLLGSRLCVSGAGTFGWASGNLEFDEIPEGCAVREIAEATGLVITPEMLVPLYGSNTMAYGSHYIDIEFRCEIPDGGPRVMEPDKLEARTSRPIGALPEPMFEAATMAHLVDGVRKLIRRPHFSEALDPLYQVLTMDFRVADFRDALFQHRARRNWVAS